jgi:hypothetical protein
MKIKEHVLIPNPNNRWLHVRVEKDLMMKFKADLLYKEISMQQALYEFVVAVVRQNAAAITLLDRAAANKARRKLQRIEAIRAQKMQPKVVEDPSDKNLLYAMIEEEKNE